MTGANRIDVHQHVLPPAYVEWLKSKDIAAVQYFTAGLDGYSGIADHAAIDRDNATALFPPVGN